LSAVVNLAEKLSLFSDHWHPHIVGELNGQHVKVVKIIGEFVWHHHIDEDELFMVLLGELRMRLPDREVSIHPGEFFIVPKGVEHCPFAQEECHVLLLEPAATRNTGNLDDARTVYSPEWI